jgi:hypothetical protein
MSGEREFVRVFTGGVTQENAVQWGMVRSMTMPQWTRRDAMLNLVGLGVGVGISAVLPGAAMPATEGAERRGVEPAGEPGWPGFPKQNEDLAREFVGVCHTKFDRAKELLDAHPGLVHAATDWGFGDWETGLGAASHVGRREIALLLIERGARVDIFAAAMLGWTDTVRAMLAAAPALSRALGPHNIPLLAHSKAGGEMATETARYVESLGDADRSPSKAARPLTAEQQGVFVGEYALDGATSDAHRFAIVVDRAQLSMKPKAGSSRGVFVIGENEFFPVGVPSVRLRFEVMDGKATAVVIADGAMTVRAVRLG